MAANDAVVEASVRMPASRAEWPRAGIDLTALREAGWRPTPFREFVLKVHGRCNLACDYCYVYEKADQTWRAKPPAMPASTLAATARRIAEHAHRHSLSWVRVVLHGGEPLLLGRQAIAEAATTLREAVAPTELRLGIQTNGVLLTPGVLDVLLEHRVKVGVSIDGAPADHDRHRRFPNGKGSHSAVRAGLDRLRREPYRSIYSGLLVTVDLDADPCRTHEALLELSPPAIDYLLPHGNWTHPPAGRDLSSLSTPYADWLIEVFDLWYAAPRRQTGVRLFDDIINLALGGRSHTESVGLTAACLAVVDTDGAIEQVDALKAAYPGAAATGLDVFTSPFDAALAHPGIVARQIGAAALCDTCRRCDVHEVCGGGHYAHRYRAGAGFLNPSVYCADLMRLVRHIQRRVRRDARALAAR